MDQSPNHLATSQVSQATNFHEEEYSNYIDSSDIVVEYYKNTKVSGLEKYFLQIDNWLEKDFSQNETNNKPLVIQAEEGFGKKTLLVKWMEYHQENAQKPHPDITLLHFASNGGNNANFYFAIYRFLNKLRELLDIRQKVELLEEKLRVYFQYWLNVCSNSLTKQVLDDKQDTYDKIILVIEGIDKFIDQQTNSEALVSYWLPKFFPNRIRVIVTADQGSEALKYFQSINCEVMSIPIDTSIISDMISSHAQKELFISDDLKTKHFEILAKYDDSIKNNLFVKTFLTFLLPDVMPSIVKKEDINAGQLNSIYASLDLDTLGSLAEQNQLIEFCLDEIASKIMDPCKLRKLLITFNVSQKGLTYDELLEVSQLGLEEDKMFFALFKNFLIKYKGLWILNNDNLKKAIQSKYMQDPQEINRIHEEIASAIEKKTPNSIRKLEEQTYHLFKSKSYIKLKETISAIENFLLLFNPNNKYDLYRYWQILEENKFDPITEYNNAIEGFQMHYYPNAEDIFRIIVQTSRFLKEFSDFETYFTPQFRHPLINGTFEELNDIGLMREIWVLQIFNSKTLSSKDIQEKLEKVPNQSTSERIKERVEKKKMQASRPANFLSELNSSRQINPNEQLSYSVNLKETKSRKLGRINKVTSEPHLKLTGLQDKQPDSNLNLILNEFEQINIELPANRQRFRQYYIQKIINSVTDNDDAQRVDTDPATQNARGGAAAQHQLKKIKQSQERIYDEETQDIRKDLGSQQSLDQPQLHQTAKEINFKNVTFDQVLDNYRLKQPAPSNYYYKRWLWIQFPWACTSLACDYSTKMKQCFASATEYMSVQEEKQFTKQALKIAIEAKLKKQMVYQKRGNAESTIPNVEASAFSVNNSVLSQRKPGREQKPKHSPKNGSDSYLQNSSHMYDLLQPQQVAQGGNPNQGDKSRNRGPGPKESKFFITENNYLDMGNLHREVEFIKQNAKKEDPNSKAVNVFEQSGQNTSLVLQKQKVLKDKSLFFNPLNSIKHQLQPTPQTTKSQGSVKISLNASSSQPKLNTLLPQLNTNLTSHSNQELKILERQFLEMRKTNDDLHNENISLAKRLRDLKTCIKSQEANMNEEQIQQQQAKVQSLNEQISKSDEQYYLSQVQIERLQKIILVCRENKIQNTEWIRALNFLLENLKKMISFEQKGIAATESEIREIQKLIQQVKDVQKDQMTAHNLLLSQISSDIEKKKKVDHLFNQSDVVIENEANDQIQKIQKEQKEQDEKQMLQQKITHREKITKQIEGKLEEMKQYYVMVSQVIDLDDENYDQQPQFKTFLNRLEKHSELKKNLIEKDQNISELQNSINDKQNYLDVVKKAFAKLNPGQGKQPVDDKQEENQENEPDSARLSKDDLLEKSVIIEQNTITLAPQHKKNLQQRLSYLMTVQTIQKKLELDQSDNSSPNIQLSSEKIAEVLKQKLDVIKSTLGEEDYASFLQGQYATNKVLQGIIKRK